MERNNTKIGDLKFQGNVLATLFRNHLFCLKNLRYLKRDYFTTVDFQDVFACLEDYVGRYKTVPSTDMMIHFMESNKVDDGVITLTKELYGKPALESEYVMDEITSFVKTQEWKLVLENVDEFLSDKRFKELENKVVDIMSIGTRREKETYDYLENIEDRIVREKSTSRTVPTGIIGLDEVLDSNGLGDGELGLVMAPPSGGKTSTLINLGKNMLLRGNNVVHFTEELSDKKTARRYDQAITGMTKNEMVRLPKRVMDIVIESMEKMKKRLIIKEHPSNTCSVLVMKKEVEEIADLNGITPDAIIVDYADLLVPARNYEQKRFELEDIYRGLRGMAQQLASRVWTASQTQSETIKGARHIGMEHLSESIVGKAAICDVIISVNQTTEQRKMKRGEIFIAKNRDGERDISIPIHIDWSRMRMGDLSEMRDNVNRRARSDG